MSLFRGLFSLLVALILVSQLLFSTAWGKERRARGISPEPVYEAELLMEAETGLVLVEENPHKVWRPASMVKMMLMLIVMEKVKEGSLKLTDMVTVSAAASKMGGSQVFLKEGEQFALEELLKALWIASANDASLAVAEHVAGSSEAFVELMNYRAKELGLEHTRYVSVHGLPPEKGGEPDLTCAYDLATLARELLRYPDLLRWGSTAEEAFRDGKFILTNTNHLVRSFQGMNGMKTGYYKEAGYNITATAERGGLKLIAVVLGVPKSKMRFDEAARLLGSGFNLYKRVKAVAKGEAVGGPIPVARAKVKTIQPVAAEDIFVLIRRGQEKSLEKEFLPIGGVEAPVARGAPLGEVVIKSNGQVVGRGKVVVPLDVPRASWIRRLF